MNLKTYKRGFKKENMNPNHHVHCCINSCHGNSLLHLVCTKLSIVSDFYGENKVFWNLLYLDDNAKFDLKLYTQCFSESFSL